MAYNTGNPIGSTDPRDLVDNAENFDKAVNAEAQDSWTDRLGRPRKTWDAIEREAAELTQAATEQADRAEQEADRAADEADRAETARDAAQAAALTVGAFAATTLAAAITDGLDATTDGQHFAATGDDVDYVGWYRKDSGPVATEIARYPTAGIVDRIFSGENFHNLFKPGTETRGKAIVSTGQIIDSATGYITDYLPAIPGAVYSLPVRASGSRLIAFYRPDLTYIGVISVPAGVGTFKAPNPSVALGFMRINGDLVNDPISRFAVVQAPELPAQYSMYAGYRVMTEQLANAANGYAGTDADGKISSSVVKTLSDVQNLFDPATVTHGQLLVYNTGATYTNAGYYTSDFIAVEPGATYRFSPASEDRLISFYDADGAFIATTRNTSKFTVPSNVSRVRISLRYSDTPVANAYVIRGELPLEWRLTFPSSSQPLSGKIIAAIGDSITYGMIPRNHAGYPGQLLSYLPLVAAKLGASSYLNYGISGSTLAYSANSPMTRRYSSMSNSADLVIVMGGTNDVRTHIALGALGDTTDSTFYGGLDVMCAGLLNKYRYDQGTETGAGKKIMFMTPPRFLKANFSGLETDALPYVEAIKAVCQKYSIPVFDAWNLSGLTAELFRTLQGTETGFTAMYNPFVPDGLHPSQDGHRILADAVSGFIRGLY